MTKIAKTNENVKKNGFTPLFRDQQEVLVRLRPAEMRAMTILLSMANGRWHESFSERYVEKSLGLRKKYAREILADLEKLGVLGIERLENHRFGFSNKISENLREIHARLDARPKRGRPKGSKNKPKPVAPEVRTSSASDDEANLPLFRGVKNNTPEERLGGLRKNFVSCQTQQMMLFSTEDLEPIFLQKRRSSTVAAAPHPKAMADKNPVTAGSLSSMEQDPLMEFFPEFFPEVYGETCGSSAFTMAPPAAPVAVAPPAAPVAVAPPAAPVAVAPPAAPVVVAPPVQVAPSISKILEGLAIKLVKSVQQERPGKPTPSLSFVQDRLAQLEQIHGVKVLEKYIEQDVVRVCGRPEVVSAIHVFTSKKWFETWIEASNVLVDLHRSDKEQKDLDALVRFAKNLPIEAGLSEGTIRKLLGSLLSRGSLPSIKAYLQKVFHEFRQAHGDFGVSPLQLACDPERAQDGIWAIEKVCANKELAAQVAKVFDGEVPMIPMKTVLKDVMKATPRPPSPTPMASTSPPAPTAPPAPPYTPRGPYQSPGSTPQQVATNAVGARAALEALRGPPAEPTLPSEFFGSSPQDGETKDYRGYRYRFFEAKGFWKRIQVVREFAA